MGLSKQRGLSERLERKCVAQAQGRLPGARDAATRTMAQKQTTQSRETREHQLGYSGPTVYAKLEQSDSNKHRIFCSLASTHLAGAAFPRGIPHARTICCSALPPPCAPISRAPNFVPRAGGSRYRPAKFFYSSREAIHGRRAICRVNYKHSQLLCELRNYISQLSLT